MGGGRNAGGEWLYDLWRQGREEGVASAELEVGLEESKERKICTWLITSLAGVVIFVLQLLLESLT